MLNCTLKNTSIVLSRDKKGKRCQHMIEDDNVRNASSESEINGDDNFGNKHLSCVVNITELRKTDPFDFNSNGK